MIDSRCLENFGPYSLGVKTVSAHLQLPRTPSKDGYKQGGRSGVIRFVLAEDPLTKQVHVYPSSKNNPLIRSVPPPRRPIQIRTAMRSWFHERWDCDRANNRKLIFYNTIKKGVPRGNVP